MLLILALMILTSCAKDPTIKKEVSTQSQKKTIACDFDQPEKEKSGNEKGPDAQKESREANDSETIITETPETELPITPPEQTPEQVVDTEEASPLPEDNDDLASSNESQNIDKLLLESKIKIFQRLEQNFVEDSHYFFSQVSEVSQIKLIKKTDAPLDLKQIDNNLSLIKVILDVVESENEYPEEIAIKISLMQELFSGLKLTRPMIYIFEMLQSIEKGIEYNFASEELEQQTKDLEDFLEKQKDQIKESYFFFYPDKGPSFFESQYLVLKEKVQTYQNYFAETD
ncbi:MAG: hypothetical protein ACPGJV_08575 [Bacteriovoracaceae bacterium]